ncbi:hypothetical protein GY45DRAFT_1371691 [Cubamyces sp. BRFM 1775]|nr:hypothetical protein GY45DRAFT_1371691 [Cubamyces sp. BRFM 1775]
MPNGNSQQPSMQMATPQLPPQLANQHNQHVQRTATTPLQGLNTGVAPSGPQSAQNGMPNGFPNVGMGAPGGQPGQPAQPNQQQQAQQRDQQLQMQQRQLLAGFVARPMTRELFNTVYYNNWLPKNPKDQSLLVYENRTIDLYQLHYEVMNAGGVANVMQNDLWPVIGANLGFVNIPASGNEPAKAGPALAHRVANIYKEFLSVFDRHYTVSMARRYQQTKQQQMGVANMENGAQAPTQNAGSSAPTAPGPAGGIQALNSLRSLTEIRDTQTMSEIISYSIIPTAELQRRNVPQQLIELVEQNRDQLRNMFEQQRAFRTHVAQNSQGGQNQGGVPQVLPRNASGPMQASQLQGGMPGQNGMSALRQPGMPQVPQQANMAAPSAPGMAQNAASQQQQQAQLNGAGAARPARPTPIQQQAAIALVTKVKNECKGSAPFANRPLHNIPDAQRLEYNTLFEQLHRLITELDHKLPHYACVMKEDAIRKLVLMVLAVQQQRELLSSGVPKYFLPLDAIKGMMKQVQSAAEAFKAFVLSAQQNAVASASGVQFAPNGAMQRPTPIPPTHMNVNQPQPAPIAPPAPAPVVAPASSPAVAPIQKKPTPKPHAEPHAVSASAATPAANVPSTSAATPAASAPTPTHVVSSPQTPKSPKAKPAAKAKQPPKPRKASVKTATASTPVAAPAASPAAGPSEAKPPATPATPASAPTPDASAGSKRPREEEVMVPSAAAPAQPAAKKMKTEFDDPPNNSQAQRQAQADEVKNGDDAVKFFEQISDWLTQMDGTQESINTEIADSLDEILKTYPTTAEESSFAGSSFFDSITVGSSSPKLDATTVDPSDFFDFSSYGVPEEDTGSKVATPDLVQASSVGPSPGSASETEAHPPASSHTADTAKIVDPKSEPNEGGDAIPQELWRAIDGGESSFYNASDNWKWDQPMAAVDQPWAFYPS